MYIKVMFNKYIKRICNKKIKEMLEIFGAIWIQGPKWCGKSTTAKTFSKSNIELQNNQTLELISKYRIILIIFSKKQHLY